MTSRRLPPRTTLIGPVLLTVCNVMAVVAIISFASRVGEFPVHAVEWLLYPITIGAAVISLVVAFRTVHHQNGDDAHPALHLGALAPLFAVFQLFASQGGPYANWHVHQPETVGLWHGVLAITIAIAAILAGSWRLFVFGLVGQLILFTGVELGSLRWDLTYQDAQMLGPLVVPYLVGAVFLYGRRAWSAVPEPALRRTAVTLIAVVGALMLAGLIYSLPGNGAPLPWHASGWHVPWDAWNVLRPATIALCLVTALGLSGVVCFDLGTVWAVGDREGAAWRVSREVSTS